MAAYAALVSLMHIINQIQNHPRPPISLDQTQVESLTENITFLQKFLQGYSSRVSYSKEADTLEMRIADAAYGGEDVIESYILDQIHAGEEISSIDFNEGLHKVIENLDFIKAEATEIIKEKMGVHDWSPRGSSVSIGSSRSRSTWQNSVMVGSDDVLNEALDKLTGQQYNLQIIPIVGMGGIGKTTLARNIYANPLIVEHFDILVWVTISQEYSRRDVLLQVLCQKNKWSMNYLSGKNEEELGEILYQDLSGRRYLVVMDDIWDIDAWYKMKFFFPDNNNGSRIMMTTRLSNLAFELTGSYGLRMNFLGEDKSWNLLCKIIFGKEECPLELADIGKKIAKNSRGLPLSVVVIGGLLKNSKAIKEYWEYTLERLNSVINLEDNERCVQTLYTSYKELPVHLKPCFLYMGIFPEDREIHVSELIKLWVAEGFLKSIDGKSLEVAAEEYLEELIERNLILVHKLGSNGKTKDCKIHDLLRDLCLREAQKQKFLCVRRLHSLQGIDTERRIIIHRSLPEEEYDSHQIFEALQSASLVRSLIVDQASDDVAGVLRHTNLRLLRVFKVDTHSDICDIHMLYNLRYFSSTSTEELWDFSFLIRHWNLHTIIARRLRAISFPEIWVLPLLRHVELLGVFEIPNPSGGRDKAILGNLQTLFHTYIENCIETVIERIPNITKLKAFDLRDYNINFDHLHKLEHLTCLFSSPIRRELLQNLNFTHSLKKLILEGCELRWEDVTTKIGSLPLLEVLKLMCNSVIGTEWVTVEGQFCNLKYLLIYLCGDLVYWITDSSHFPRLEQLHLLYLYNLEEVPSVIGEIPTLQLIRVYDCSYCSIISVINILKEQQELGNEGLRVCANYQYYDEATGVWRDRAFNRIARLDDNRQTGGDHINDWNDC